MPAESLIDIVNKLTPEEQSAVREFVEYLKKRGASPFRAAVAEFMDEHPELLRRLAQ
jgi:hypothetical protein